LSRLGAAIEAVRERVARACARSGRDPAEVRIVAVSKTFPVEDVRELVHSGHTLFGENRVQEALRKIPLAGPEVTWHLVGHLQRNKAKHAVGAFALLHGVDSDELAREIDRCAARASLRQRVLIQVNVGSEPTKAGVAPEALDELVECVATLEHVELQGLMAIPPQEDTPEASRPWFKKLRELRDGSRNRVGRALPELSMGMTDDFEVAIEEGATLVRIGRAIFGERG
jgi:pyridoxal phosphate enzyme (YggS family)